MHVADSLKLVGIVIKDNSSRAFNTAEVLKGYLRSRDIEYLILQSKKGAIEKNALDKIPACDLAVAIGGDGTLLFTARVFSQYGIPIAGINLGGLGFITEFREAEVVECVQCFISSMHSFEERMMIDITVNRGGASCFQSKGLNDMVISTGGISRLLELEVSNGNRFIGTYRADGIIVATPTGSTAYSLSAGGPILEPTTEAFVICPICPHSLGARPLVVPPREDIIIRILSTHRKVITTVDGQLAFDVQDGDEVLVSKSETVTKLISLGNRSFYDIVREKLAWKG